MARPGTTSRSSGGQLHVGRYFAVLALLLGTLYSIVFFTGSAPTPRLGLDTTVHIGRFDDSELAGKVAAYDGRLEAYRPFARQRDPQRFGTAPDYGWSEDKARQYAEPLRADFGAFVRAKGFRLD